MRTKQSIINISVNIAGQFLNFLLAVLSRSVLAKVFPGEYLGINGLFTNILNILSLAELGISTAMLYAFYKPVAENNISEIRELMNFYRRIYRLIALLVTCLGILLIPFLNILVKDADQIENLVIMYLLYLVQTISSYLFIYKTSIITANQKQYICNIYTYACTVCRYIIQIVILLWMKDFLIYLLVQIVFAILPNILASRKAEKMYPYIVEDRNSYPDKAVRKEILKNVRAMFSHKLGSVLVYNTDNLIMSAFVGLGGVGIYSNYKLISSNLSSVLSQIFAGMAASIGNLAATSERKRVLDVFNMLNFLCFLLYGYSTVMMAVLFEPFIKIFFNKSFLLGRWTVLILLMEFYITGMRQVMQQFRNAMGTFWYDRYKPIVEVIINLVISLALVRRYQIGGILAGTVLSLLLVSFWVEPYVFFKYSIKENIGKNMKKYFGQYFLRVCFIVVAYLGINRVCIMLPGENFIGLILRGLIASIIYGIFMTVIFFKTVEWRNLMKISIAFLRREKKNELDS